MTLSRRRVQKMREREANAGIDPADAAARWLDEHDPPPAPQPPKAARKSKALHRFRQGHGK
ncbi:MAG TPA: hypothetical protein VFA56_01430 [Gaiellaceae bacterium]|nr:hypothetical protein [Gaiellaceae bacterium]